MNEITQENFEKLYSNIKSLIDESRRQVIIKVNNILTITYWNIGKTIRENVLKSNRAEYGNKTIKKLGKKLEIEYGNGFSNSNLTRMIKFYDFFNNDEIVVTLSQQFTWSHFVELIKINDDIKREFYISMCKNERWVVRTLRERINSMLFERTAISKKPEEAIKNEIELLSKENKMTESMLIRDPYLLDFLDLKTSFVEKDLENAILEELEKFILEFGSDFAFMSKQKRIQIGNNDYRMDLLFYHRKLRRLVLIELKIGEFKPEYKGQVELYLKWLSKYEKQDYEEEPIAIILCSGKDQDVVELMDLGKDNIHISEYWLELPPENILKEKLYKAIEYAKARLESK